MSFDILAEVKYVDVVECVEKLGLGYFLLEYSLQVCAYFDGSCDLRELR